MAYGEKNLTFQGPLPEKIELLSTDGLLNLTYHQSIQVLRQDLQIFEVSTAGSGGRPTCAKSQGVLLLGCCYFSLHCDDASYCDAHEADVVGWGWS